MIQSSRTPSCTSAEYKASALALLVRFSYRSPYGYGVRNVRPDTSTNVPASAAPSDRHRGMPVARIRLLKTRVCYSKALAVLGAMGRESEGFYWIHFVHLVRGSSEVGAP